MQRTGQGVSRIIQQGKRDSVLEASKALSGRLLRLLDHRDPDNKGTISAKKLGGEIARALRRQPEKARADDMRILVLAIVMALAAACAAQAGYVWAPFSADTATGVDFLAPPPDAAVAGPFDVKVRYDLGAGGEATMAELYLDEQRYFARPILDGKARGECLFAVQSADFPDGPHLLTAVISDARAEKHIASRRIRIGNTGVGPGGAGRLEPRTQDTTPPKIEIVRPSFGQTVWGKFDLLVAASDESGNPIVSMYIDGRNVLTSNNPPYTWMWDTRLAANGLHEVGAIAYDRALNKAQANPVAVKVANEQLTTGAEDLLAGGLASRIAPVTSQIHRAVQGPLLGMIAQQQATHRSARVSPQQAEAPEVRLELEIPLDEEPSVPEAAGPVAVEASGEPSTSIPGQGPEEPEAPVEPNWVVARREAVQVVMAQQAPRSPQLTLAPQMPVEEEEEAQVGEEVVSDGVPAVLPEVPRTVVALTRPEIVQAAKEMELQPVIEVVASSQADAAPASPPSESRPARALTPQAVSAVPKAERVGSQASRPAAAEPSAPAEEEKPTQVAAAQIAPMVRAALPAPKIAVYLDSRLVSFDVDPLVKNGYTITPIRHVVETLGGSVMWYSETKTVMANCRSRALRLKIGDREALVDTQTQQIPLAPYLTAGRTMVPLRFLGDALGLSLQYDRASGIVYAASGEAASQ